MALVAQSDFLLSDSSCEKPSCQLRSTHIDFVVRGLLDSLRWNALMFGSSEREQRSEIKPLSVANSCKCSRTVSVGKSTLCCGQMPHDLRISFSWYFRLNPSMLRSGRRLSCWLIHERFTWRRQSLAESSQSAC